MSLRRIGAALLAATLATAGLVLVQPSPAHAGGSFEFESSVTISPSSAGQVSTYSPASNSSLVGLWDAGTATKSFTTSVSTGELKIYMSGWACQNTSTGVTLPEVQIKVDGTMVGGPRQIKYATQFGYPQSLSAPGDIYRFWGPWAAGTHTISVELTNPYNSGTCYRMASIDKIDYIDGSGFVTRSGDELQLNGNRYRYVGWNAFGMMGCDNGGTPWTNTQLDNFFKQNTAGSVTRTWAFGGQSNTTDLARILASARKYQQKVMFSLGDGPSYCESEGRAGNEGEGKTDTFYDSGFRTNYKPHVYTVVDYFKNDPTVFGWEIMNEPGHGSVYTYGGGVSGMEAFIDEMADYIDSIDANHLVISGTMSAINSYTSDFQDIHDHADIDIGTVHEYHYDYSTTTPKENVSPEVAYRAADMQAINKPLLITETGTFGGANCTDDLYERREIVHDRMLAYVGIGTGGTTGVEGVNVWNAMLDTTGVNLCSDQRAHDVTNGDPYFYRAGQHNDQMPK